MSAAAFTIVTLACGWIALWPLRARLGGVYHLAAYPIGLLGWIVVAGVATLTQGAWDAFDMGLGLGLAALAASLIAGRLATDGESHGAIPVWTFGAWAVALAAAAWAVHSWGITAGTYDSVFHYETWGIWLADGHGLRPPITGAFGLLVPATAAGGRVFGIEWMSTPWPLLALHVAGLVAYGIVWGRPRLSRAKTTPIAAAIVVLLATTTPFAGHTLYVHSHMLSACYLLLALLAIEHGLTRGADGDDGWLFAGGLAMAGLALTRVDGLAYAAVPLLVAGVTRIDRRMGAGRLVPLVVGFGVPVGLYAATAYATLGFWDSDKLSGTAMVAVLIALVALACLALWAERLPRIGDRISERPVAWVVGATASVLTVLTVVRFETVSTAATLMVSNLFVFGGFGTLWYVITAMIVLSVLVRSAWMTDEWPARLLLAMGLFGALALAVHGTGHPGRVGPGDSFSRVAFHIVPVVFWYGGLFAKGLLTPVSDEGVSTGVR